jgi:RNA methyltransferase, TrmH family
MRTKLVVILRHCEGMISKNQMRYVKSLRLQKHRMEHQQFTVEGTKSVLELLDSDFEVEFIICSEDHPEPSTSVPVHLVSTRDMKELSALTTPPGLMAVVKLPNWYLSPSAPSEADVNKGILVLDGVRDPGNLGTLIRTAEWFGFKRILADSDTVDCFNPKVVQASMGSVFRMEVLYHSLETFSGIEAPWYGLDLGGSSLFEQTSTRGYFVVGNESHGLRAAVRERITEYLHIPGGGNAESLNAAMSGAILLSELFRKGMNS